MATVSMGRFVIAVSPDGVDGWTLLKPEAVPEWLKEPKIMGELADGMIAHEPSDAANPWYCAVMVPHLAANEPLAESEASAILPAPSKNVVGLQVVGRLVDQGGIPLPDPPEAA